MLEEYIFYNSKKHAALNSLQFSNYSGDDGAFSKINCYSLREIIQKKAFEIRFEIRYADEENPNNGKEV